MPGSSGNLHYNPGLQGMFPWFTGASKEKERGQRLYPNRESLPAASLGFWSAQGSGLRRQSKAQRNNSTLTAYPLNIRCNHWHEVDEAGSISRKAIPEAVPITSLPLKVWRAQVEMKREVRGRVNRRCHDYLFPGWGRRRPSFFPSFFPPWFFVNFLNSLQ